jgi:hypothetical protein
MKNNHLKKTLTENAITLIELAKQTTTSATEEVSKSFHEACNKLLSCTISDLHVVFVGKALTVVQHEKNTLKPVYRLGKIYLEAESDSVELNTFINKHSHGKSSKTLPNVYWL